MKCKQNTNWKQKKLRIVSEIEELQQRLQSETFRLQALINEEIYKRKTTKMEFEEKISELETAKSLLKSKIEDKQASIDQLTKALDSSSEEGENVDKAAALKKISNILKESNLKKELEREAKEKEEFEKELQEVNLKLQAQQEENAKKLKAVQDELQAQLEKSENEIKVQTLLLKKERTKSSVLASEKVSLSLNKKALDRKLYSERLKFEQLLDVELEQNKELEAKVNEQKQELEKLKTDLEKLQEESAAGQPSALSQLVLLPFNISEMHTSHLEGIMKVKRSGAKFSRFGFKKYYAHVSNFKINMYNNEVELNNKKTPTFTIAVKSSVFIVQGASAEYTRNVAAYEAPFVFAVYEKEGAEYDPKYHPNLEDEDGAQIFDLQPTLFMAKNEKDKVRWMIGLQQLRNKFILSHF